MTENYQLRKAAGLYWLIDMDQDGSEFHSPVRLNESGAFLWRLLERGMNREQLAEALCGEYELEKKNAEKDVDLFFQQLKQNQIRIS